MKNRATIIMAALLLVAGGLFVVLRQQSESGPPADQRHPVWSFEAEQLHGIDISLPKAGKREAWVKHEDRYWYFVRPDGPKVDMNRWGGGVPLLLSGPKAERAIASQVTADSLGMYGFRDPRMKIALSLVDGVTINVEVGDRTPDGKGDYVRVTDTTDVYSVDSTWYDVLERLVLEPPIPAGPDL